MTYHCFVSILSSLVLTQPHPCEQAPFAHPFFFQQPDFELQQSRIRKRMPDDRMPPLICFASLVDADETLPPILGQPHLPPGDLEVYVFVPLPTVNRGDDR